MENRDVERALEQIAQVLELKGENTFKVRAYENAARAIGQLQEEVAALVKGGGLGEVRGIGKSIHDKVTGLVNTGRLAYLDELMAGLPPLAQVRAVVLRSIKDPGDYMGYPPVEKKRFVRIQKAIVDLPEMRAEWVESHEETNGEA